MKKILLLIFLLYPLLTFTRAQEERITSVAALQQSLGSRLDLRINHMYEDGNFPFNFYIHNLDFTLRQDYSNPSRYVFSLNPAIWGVEYILSSLFWDVDSTGKGSWTSVIPFAVFIADNIANYKIEIYGLRLGWNTDFYIYDKKFCAVFEMSAILNYDFKRFGIYAGIKKPVSDHLNFMAPYESSNGQIIFGLVYKFYEGSVPDLSGPRRVIAAVPK